MKIQNKKKMHTKKNMPLFFFTVASYSYLLPSIPQTFFNAVAPSIIHFSAQLLSSITHKQTRLPTHAFLTTKIE
jgi:hypothetical protein